MNQKTIVRQFVSRISEEDIRFLHSRLSDRLSNDLSEALNYMSKYRDIDSLFSATKSAYEIYDLCDLIQREVRQECVKRGIAVFGDPVAA